VTECKVLLLNTNVNKPIVYKDKRGVLNLLNYVPTFATVHDDAMCKLRSGIFVKLALCDIPELKNPKLLHYEHGGEQAISYDLYYAFKVFAVKSQLVTLANAFDDEHKAEKEYTLKIIGILNPIFLT